MQKQCPEVILGESKAFKSGGKNLRPILDFSVLFFFSLSFSFLPFFLFFIFGNSILHGQRAVHLYLLGYGNNSYPYGTYNVEISLTLTLFQMQNVRTFERVTFPWRKVLFNSDHHLLITFLYLVFICFLKFRKVILV